MKLDKHSTKSNIKENLDLKMVNNNEIENLNWDEIKSKLNEILPNNKKLEENNIEQLKNFIAGFNSLLSILNLNNKIEENIILGKSFLNSAEENLKIAKFSFKNKLYASAIHNLTLATEKLVKSYGLICFRIRKEDLKGNISHKSPLTYAIMMEGEPYKSYLEIMRSFYPDLLNKNHSDLNNLINNEENKSKILKAGKEEIEKILDYYQKIENIFDNNFQNQFKNIEERSCSVVAASNRKIKDNVKVDYFLKLVIDYFPKLVISFTNLACLSFITFPHYFPSNYPDAAQNEGIEYNEKLGIAQSFDRIYSILVNCHKNLSEYLNTLNKSNEDKNRHAR